MFTTSKDILLKNNLLDQKSDGKRHPANEFQAYAYRLANDLRDLQRLKIYMRLAKTVDRSLMERAYAFVSDSHANDKGRLFLWKVKKLREEIENQKSLTNFTYENVQKINKKFKDKFSNEIVNKANTSIDTNKKEVLYKTLETLTIKSSILLLGSYPNALFDYLNNIGCKVRLLEDSKNISTLLRKYNSRNKHVKIINKDLLKKIFNNEKFDLILLNNYWGFIPLDSEMKVLRALKKILKDDATVFLNINHHSALTQEWRFVNFKKEDLYYLYKRNTYKSFEEKCEAVGFKFERVFSDEKEDYYALLKC